MVLAFQATATPPAQNLRLMPMPEQVVLNPGRFSINGSFAVQLTGPGDPRLKNAVARLLQKLQKKTGIPMPPDAIAGAVPKQATMQIQCTGRGDPVQSVDADESYHLEVTDRQARLSALSPIGILRGIETFLQLVDADRLARNGRLTTEPVLPAFITQNRVGAGVYFAILFGANQTPDCCAKPKRLEVTACDDETPYSLRGPASVQG